MEFIEGRFISNGDKNLYVKITGSGSPAVVIETGWGGLSSEWFLVQSALSKYTTVVSYDRAGYGESPSGSKPRTGKQIAGELYNMLVNANIDSPYILIGHSAGGVYIRQFADMFPGRVDGLVFVDSITVYNDEFDRLDTPKYKQLVSIPTMMKNFGQYADMEKDEFMTKVVPFIYKFYANFPESMKLQLITYLSDQNFYRTVLDEFEASKETFGYVREFSGNTNIATKVICHDCNAMIGTLCQFGVPEAEARAAEELWLKQSKDLANLSTESEFIIADKALHNIHLEAPELIVDTVLKLITH